MIPNNIHAQSCFHLEGSASSWKCKISLLNEMPYFLKKPLYDCRLTHRLANICNLVSFYPPNHFSIDVLHSFQGLAHPLLYVMPYSGETLCEAGLYQTVIGMGLFHDPIVPCLRMLEWRFFLFSPYLSWNIGLPPSHLLKLSENSECPIAQSNEVEKEKP